VEDNVDAACVGLSGGDAAIITPTHPLVTLAAEVLRVQPEVAVSDLVVGQLAQSAGQSGVADRAVVGEVVEIHLGAATISLSRVIRHHGVCTYTEHSTQSIGAFRTFFSLRISDILT